MAERAKLGWMQRIQDYYWLHNVLRSHPDLEYWVVHRRPGRPLAWLTVSEESERLQPFHFEVHFERTAIRDAYLERAFRTAARARRLHVAELYGFHDLFFPLHLSAANSAYFYAGQFVLAPLDRPQLEAAWSAVSGLSPSTTDPAYLRFARMALALPVLPPSLLAGVEALAALFGDYVGGREGRGRVETRAREIRRGYFLPDYPDRRWLRTVIDPDRYRVTPWFLEGGLSEWMREEMGIERLPTTALALMPVLPPEIASNPVAALVEVHRVRRACLELVRELPFAAADGLGEHGVFFLASPTPGRRPARQKSEIDALVDRIVGHVRSAVGWSSVVGVGRTLPPGEALQQTFREAVVALHLAVQLRRERLHFGVDDSVVDVATSRRVHEAARGLASAFRRGESPEIRLAADAYVSHVLRLTQGGVEATRSHLLDALHATADEVERQHLGAQGVVALTTDELAPSLEAATTAGELIECFRTALERLEGALGGRLHGEYQVRVEALLKHVDAALAETQRLPEVARRAGFSVATFTRVFRRSTGVSFARYVRRRRVELAKALLRTSQLTVERIAQDTGFSSSHQLIRAFKKETGRTPAAYRRDEAVDAEGRPRDRRRAT